MMFSTKKHEEFLNMEDKKLGAYYTSDFAWRNLVKKLKSFRCAFHYFQIWLLI